MNQFKKGVPSVFVVWSPFQILCAIAAIRQLDIEDYKLIVYFPKHGSRNDQVEDLLKQYSLKYSSFTFPPILMRPISFLLRYYSLLPKKNGYSRLFIGDYRDFFEHIVGSCYCADGADVIYLDDGNITINILKNKYADTLSGRFEKWVKKINTKRGIECWKNLLTIYGDIPNAIYNIERLNLGFIFKKDISACEHRNIYIVGTNLIRYCEPLEIPESYYITKLGELMEKLRLLYPNDSVYFFPHGLETKEYGESLCAKYGCVYYRPKTMIELELINRDYPPKAIYGYTSTALLTLKKIFPSSRIVNITFKSPDNNAYYIDFVECSKYYEQNGIEWVKESL